MTATSIESPPGSGPLIRNAGQEEFRFAGMMALGCFLVYFAFLAPGIYALDGNSMLAVAESIVSQHSITVPAGLGIAGVGGRIYSTWYPLLSLIAVPFAYVALIASRLIHLPFHYLAAMVVLPINAALTAATVWMVALLSRRIGASQKGARLAAIAFAFGTVALTYARTFFADPLLGFLTVSSVYLVAGGTRKGISIASCLAALAVLAKPTGVVVGPVLVVYLLAKRFPFWSSILPGLGAAFGAAAYCGYDILRFGHATNVGYALPFHWVNVPAGVAGLLVSPGWGLLWYCPPATACVWALRPAKKSQRLTEVLLTMGVFAAFLLVHSMWAGWAGGWSWGPRYLLPTLPGLCALTGLVEGRKTKVLGTLIAVGFLINAPTMFSFYERYFSELMAQGTPVGEAMAWSLQEAPFLNDWAAACREVRDARATDVREAFSERAGGPSHTIEGSRALRVVALWWWVLPIAGVPRFLGVLLSAVMSLIGVWLIAKERFARSSIVRAGGAGGYRASEAE